MRRGVLFACSFHAELFKLFRREKVTAEETYFFEIGIPKNFFAEKKLGIQKEYREYRQELLKYVIKISENIF